MFVMGYAQAAGFWRWADLWRQSMNTTEAVAAECKGLVDERGNMIVTGNRDEDNKRFLFLLKELLSSDSDCWGAVRQSYTELLMNTSPSAWPARHTILEIICDSEASKFAQLCATCRNIARNASGAMWASARTAAENKIARTKIFMFYDTKR